MVRGKVPSLLSANNGGMTYDTTKVKSSCSRCKTSMPGGTRVGLLKVHSAGFTNNKRLCISCALEIINKTQADLDVIKQGAQA